MAAREVNITTTDWTATGANVQVPQYQATMGFQWRRNDGTTGSDTRVVRFPNILNGIPVERLKEYLTQICLAEARIQAGVDN